MLKIHASDMLQAMFSIAIQSSRHIYNLKNVLIDDGQIQ